MLIDEINLIRNKLKDKKPLIHAITNPISINQCANAVLAVGARPIMAEHPKEVGEITQSAKALLINLGNITDVRMESILISAAAAKKCNIPVVLDLVGIACSELRRNFVYEILEKCTPTIIKGNYSEVYALYDNEYTAGGVDADNGLDTEVVKNAMIKLSERLGAVICASGKTDIVTDAKNLIYINNGSPMLASVTGTGCMLGMLMACFVSVCADYRAAVCACAVLGISGELSVNDKGSGTFMQTLMDSISTLENADIEKYLKTEVRKIEEF